MSHARDGQHGQGWNLREFTASSKLVPLGRASGVARGAREVMAPPPTFVKCFFCGINFG